MSSTNYDVELKISYDDAHKHYIPTYRVHFPYSDRYYSEYSGWHYFYSAYVSLDDEGEQECGAKSQYSYSSSNQYFLLDSSGIYDKVYFRNPFRNYVTFKPSNCNISVNYSIKASFEVQWNSTGFAANTNASFRCSTVPKNTYKQYEWVSAIAYYKKSTEAEYMNANTTTVSGSWSDVTVSTDLSLQDGYTYDIFIVAFADDGTQAQTPVAQFTTTDAAAVATCIAPSGAFTSGDVTFIWSHATAYGTPQYAYDLQYSSNNGSSWTTVANHVVTSSTTDTTTLSSAGVYLWRVRTYNSNDVVGEWAEASFVNQVPATPPTNVQVDTKGRPTVSWVSTSQAAYQVQFLLNDSIAYDSNVVYSSETNHFVNQYFDDTRAYTVRVRVYNALGDISEWTETGYQQPPVTDVSFSITTVKNGGALITIEESEDFVKYYILRNNKVIAETTDLTYEDDYAIGLTNYSVVGVTSADQSDIQTSGFTVTYPHATLVALNGQKIQINKRVNEAYEVQTTNQADINKANFIGDGYPTHYPSDMRLKSFSVTFFDDQRMVEDLLGRLVFYADNFGNGGWCMVTAYNKTDNFIKNGQGAYANEVSLTLEVTNYDDSIKYPL